MHRHCCGFFLHDLIPANLSNFISLQLRVPPLSHAGQKYSCLRVFALPGMYLSQLSGWLILSYNSELCLKKKKNFFQRGPPYSPYLKQRACEHVQIRMYMMHTTHTHTHIDKCAIHSIHSYIHTENHSLFPYLASFFFIVLFLPKIMFLHSCSCVLSDSLPLACRLCEGRNSSCSTCYFQCPEQFLTPYLLRHKSHTIQFTY